MGAVSTAALNRVSRVSAVMREGERVTPLELFFDLVFVLALTQCTTLIGARPTWEGMLKGLLVLGVLWWSWAGYAWLTSVVDPEEGAVRLVMFAAMAAFLVAALCVPGAFGSEALLFALRLRRRARRAHRAVHDRQPRGRGAAPLGARARGQHRDRRRPLARSRRSQSARCSSACGALALLLDIGGPFLFGIDGWKLVPGHFAERHGAIVIIALGESIVAIGVGAQAHDRRGRRGRPRCSGW